MSENVLVFYGSYREHRNGLRLANYVASRLNARGVSAELIDAREIGLPILDRMYKEHPKGAAPAALEALAGAVGARPSDVKPQKLMELSKPTGALTHASIAQAIAIDSSISAAMTAEAVRTIDQNDASTSDMYSAVPIIKCQGAKPRVNATLSSGVGSVELRRNE